jgi:DNA polymerase beta
MVQYIGAHILGDDTLKNKIQECINIGGNAIQIFTKSPTNTTDKINLSDKNMQMIKNFIIKNNIYLVTHGSYMLNMSWPIHRNTWGMEMLENDLKYTNNMGGIGVVIHMGVNTPKLKMTIDEAINNFVKSISIILNNTPKNMKLILETSCNQTNSIAGKIEELSIIWNKFKNIHKKRMGFCIDTAHIFSAGYPIHKKGEFNKFIDTFDKLIGIDNILLFHINDSEAEFNSHIDKHIGLGKGHIFKNNTSQFQTIIQFCLSHSIPMILETHANYKKEIAFIKKINNISRQQNKSKENTKVNVIKILSKLSTIEKSNGNIYKHIAYLRAIKNLKTFTGDITKTNLQKIEGIGKKISSKIKEILNTGKLNQLDEDSKNIDVDSIENLNKIMGIGDIFANKLVNDYNIKNVIELKKAYENNKINLTNEQILGIKYYKHLQNKIPIKEATIFQNIIDKQLNKISSDLKFKLAGSYRRKLPELGDIDVIIYNKKSDISMKTIINGLKKIIVSTISLGETKFSGLIALKKSKSLVRRLDIRVVPYDNYWTTLLYFTGSKDFNKKMRLIAKKKGFLLNEYGLYKIASTNKIKLNINNEEDVFKKLNMKYVAPENRI